MEREYGCYVTELLAQHGGECEVVADVGSGDRRLVVVTTPYLHVLETNGGPAFGRWDETRGVFVDCDGDEVEVRT